MLKDYFLEKVTTAVTTAVEKNKLGSMTAENGYSLQVEIPKNNQFGDFAINVSSLSKFAKMAQPQIASTISEFIEKNGFEINIVAGFINFKLGKDFLNNIIKNVL